MLTCVSPTASRIGAKVLAPVDGAHPSMAAARVNGRPGLMSKGWERQARVGKQQGCTNRERFLRVDALTGFQRKLCQLPWPRGSYFVPKLGVLHHRLNLTSR